MILVDASILIAFLRNASPSILLVFESRQCAVCGITRAEILHGAKTTQDARQLTAALDQFAQLPIADEIWDQLGDHLAVLRAAGLTLPFQDVLLATIAMNWDAEVWSNDQHFQMMQAHLPALRLFTPSPI